MSEIRRVGVILYEGFEPLNGRRTTTNKGAFDWVRRQGPRVDWFARARWVEDGPFWTSGGVAAGMDMALALVARVSGPSVAERVAGYAEYEWHRDADWDPFSELRGLV